ncbi:hypothetical protein SAMN04488118_11736 [Epibacterium ulvae]|uniref:Uncharacterized protein n=1 Tax=Epibacterium ulvae TaxID=1156985 RepID=A0A1G5RHJ5_9RHOB|nr:hypothetical protein [Epibacterium ulvae]SCZ73486.1 hypothetical protein SAMN04488118_11736 [Epibacterium ulvae]
MLVITSDTLPPFIEIQELLGQFTVTHPMPMRRNLISSIMDRNKNVLQEAHQAIVDTALTAQNADGTPANLAYGIRLSTCVMEDQGSPVLILTYTGTAAIMRNISED